jgi:GntR family transcriptional regulator/MocR family aminotransferase
MRDLNREKRDVMQQALNSVMPETIISPGIEAQSSFWLGLKAGRDTDLLRQEAAKHSILVEPGNIHFLGVDEPKHNFRLGFSAIDKEKIIPGIQALNDVICSL